MGVRILEGVYDGSEDGAVMIDSATGVALGPLFTGEDPAGQIEEFQVWLRQEGWRQDPGGVFGRGGRPRPRARGTDPREWPSYALLKLVRYWRVLQEARVI